MRKIAGGMERSFEKPMGGAHRGLPTILASSLGGGASQAAPILGIILTTGTTVPCRR
jgi:hypothetical protein